MPAIPIRLPLLRPRCAARLGRATPDPCVDRYRSAVVGGLLGAGVTMSRGLEIQQPDFADTTATRPCIILSGTVNAGDLLAVCGPTAPASPTLFKGILGLLPPLSGAIERGGMKSERHRLSAASGRHRPLISDQPVTTLSPWVCVRSAGLFGEIGRAAPRYRPCDLRRRPHRL